jgi:hypothetical protein
MTVYLLRLSGWDKWIIILAFLGGASLVTTPVGIWLLTRQKPVSQFIKCPQQPTPEKKGRILKEGLFDW